MKHIRIKSNDDIFEHVRETDYDTLDELDHYFWFICRCTTNLTVKVLFKGKGDNNITDLCDLATYVMIYLEEMILDKKKFLLLFGFRTLSIRFNKKYLFGSIKKYLYKKNRCDFRVKKTEFDRRSWN